MDSDRLFSNKVEDFRQFLNDISQELMKKGDQDDVVPVRVTNPRITSVELEGECIEWCLDFLSARGCPLGFSGLLAHKVYEQLFSEGLHCYIIEETDTEQCKENTGSVQEEKVYSAEKIHDRVLEILEDVCQAWATNCPDIRIDGNLPLVSFNAIKNTRRKMEDKHIITPDLNALFGLKGHPPQSFYAVFDGHAGSEAAVFASKHLHCNLVHRCDLERDPAQACKVAFRLTDEQFITKAKQEKWKSGSTGVTALVRGNKLYLSWLGDSQAMLVRNGEVVTHMEPHKPERQDERDRIEGLGGFVMLMGDLWRVGGNLAVSRAIGDAGFKPFISSDADVLEVKLDGTEDYMVLACDGLWDVITAEELPTLVYNFLQDNSNNKHEIAKRLVQHAKENESMDNISVIVVFFRENIGIPVREEKPMFNFLAGDPSQGLDESGNEDGDRDPGKDYNERHSKGDNKEPPDGKGDKSGGQLNDDQKVVEHSSVDSNSKSKENCNKDKIQQYGLQEKGEVVSCSDAINNEDCQQSDLKPIYLTHPEISRSVDIPTVETEIEKENAHVDKLSSADRSNTPSQQRENTQEEDLDIYGVFNTRLVDGPIDLSIIDDQNSSYLLKDIADSVLNQNTRLIYGPLPEFDAYKESLRQNRNLEVEDQGVVSFEDIVERKPKKKGKKSKLDTQMGQERDARRSGAGNPPTFWAFTGKNQANVQNHKLNLAAKSHKVSNPTPGEKTLASKAPSRVTEKSVNKFALHYPTSENVHEIANMTLSHTKLESLPLPKVRRASKDPGFTVFGNKACLQTESQRFHTRLRTRKPLKPISSVIYETPPTPFMSNKLNWTRQQ